MDYDLRPESIIKYGNHISLKHNQTGRYLTSQGGFNYDGGSGQQVVFGGAWEPSDDSTFIVIPGFNSEAEPDNDVNFGEVIRLKHVTTRANLHSHDIESPLTGQQEVSCFGDDECSDENDDWILEKWTFDEEETENYDFEDPTWYVGRSFILRHVATGRALHSHDVQLNDDIVEVTGYSDGPDENDRWHVAF